MPTLDENYEIRHFAPGLDEDGVDTATARWLAAVQVAFHEKRFAGSEQEIAAALLMIADDRELTGVYLRAGSAQTPPSTAPHERLVAAGALDSSHPVGTFTSFTKTLAVGGGSVLDAHLISDVTVRPSHRRRGILRTMMVDNLTRAAESGLAVAALTATEATIYRRFGFGAATHVRSVRVRSDWPAKLLSVPAGTVELAEPAQIGDLARSVFERFHASIPGSIDRHAGEWSRKLTGSTDSAHPDLGLRAAIHASPDGDVDGYVIYSVEEHGDRSLVKVVDLVAVTPDAYLGLWDLLLSIDLASEIRWDTAPLDDPLHHALADSRRRKVTEEADLVWLRILDPVVALEARPYSVDDTLTLRVADDLGLAAGVFRVEARAGSATVTREPDDAPADVELDVAVLGSLYLGGTDPVTLGAAGLISQTTDRALLRLRALLVQERQVYGITRF